MMDDNDKVLRAWERCAVCEMSPFGSLDGYRAYIDCEYTTGLYCRKDKLIADTLVLLRQQQIMRCSGCKHYDTSQCDNGYGWCMKDDRGRTDKWYCADWVRKECKKDKG